MTKRILLAIGTVLIAFAALWYFWLGQNWTQRIPNGWEWTSSSIGTQGWADYETGEYPAEDLVNFYSRSMQVISDAGQSGGVILEDNYTTFDPATSVVTWEYIYSAPVDPKTGEHLGAEYRGDYFVFPRNVDKTTYNMRFSTYEGLPFAFQREETLEGMLTYVFYYKGRGEYTESYAGTEEYEGVTVEPGQEIKCKDDQLTGKLWVEPVTGEIVKFDEGCASGDSVYDIASGEELYALSRWTGTSAGDDVIQRIDRIRGQRTQYLWMARFLPLLLLLTGMILTGVGFVIKTEDKQPMIVSKVSEVELHDLDEIDEIIEPEEVEEVNEAMPMGM